jgi:hypothetical protein
LNCAVEQSSGGVQPISPAKAEHHSREGQRHRALVEQRIGLARRALGDAGDIRRDGLRTHAREYEVAQHDRFADRGPVERDTFDGSTIQHEDRAQPQRELAVARFDLGERLRDEPGDLTP